MKSKFAKPENEKQSQWFYSRKAIFLSFYQLQRIKILNRAIEWKIRDAKLQLPVFIFFCLLYLFLLESASKFLIM